MRVLRVYLDTSVFGGCFDQEFDVASLAVFEEIRRGAFRLVLSDATLIELQGAPDAVREVLTSRSPESVEYVPLSEETERLRDAYIDAGVVGPASHRDAEHVAAATVADVDMIVSWNFKHMVHYEKISGYQGVNLLLGYKAIRIYSPLEVV